MIPIANQPMIFYALRNLADAGVRDVAVILGPQYEAIPEAVGDGSAFGLRVTYVHQGEPRGLAHAVTCAKEFLGDEPFVMHLGDNLLQAGARPLVERFQREAVEAVIAITPVQHPNIYGVVEMEGERIVSLMEKPVNPRSNLALVGVYVFTPSIFPIIEGLHPSSRGELEITEAIWRLLQQGGRVAVERVAGWWKDTGRPEDLLEANHRVLYGMTHDAFRIAGKVLDGGTVTGPVELGAGSIIGRGARVDGPVVIGSETRIEAGAHVGPGTSIGNRCVVRQAEIQRSIIMDSAEIEGRFDLVDSIVGRFARVRTSQEREIRLSCILGDSTQLLI
jgi:glucose-1-phosphate thymidylyltransferase